MPVVDVTKDPEALTLTLTAEFPAEPARVWRLYEDPRLLERWWGPPTWPATFVRHDFEPGGGSHYFMQGPDGTRSYGVWKIVAVDAPRSFEMEDAFADDAGEPNEAMGWTRSTFTLEQAVTGDGVDGTVVKAVTTFNSAEQLEKMVAMGMEEGLKLATGQMDALLEELTV